MSGDSILHKTKIQGCDADFYQGVPAHGYLTNDLVWENKQGNLFWLSGSLDQAAMEKIAESVAEVKSEPLPEYALTALPAGASLFSRDALPEVVKEQWTVEGAGGFTWTYSSLPLHAGGTGTAETVKMNGSEGRFWQEKTQALTVVTKTEDSETTSTLGLHHQRPPLDGPGDEDQFPPPGPPGQGCPDLYGGAHHTEVT